MPSGKIKLWKPDRGFGFIAHDDNRYPDTFFHLSAVNNTSIDKIATGARVTFEEGLGKNGRPQAANVAVI